MKKILVFLLLLSFIYSSAQTLTTNTITDWNNLRKSGFYESITKGSKNLPNNDHTWYWGINMAHSVNTTNTNIPHYYGGQILFGINGNDTGLPLMYIRSTNVNGQGSWVKVLTDKGTQTISGDLNIHTLNCSNTVDNKLKSVLARLEEGNNEGEGTFLGVRSYSTQPTNAKSFSLEHKFFGKINSSINFYRGQSKIGGYIGIDVYDGKRIAKFHLDGLDVAGTIKAREIKVEVNAGAGADHVFNPDYALKPLSEIEAFIKKNKHLPEIQSEKQMQEEGLNINEFQIKLLQKIEELTLYVIDLKKENEEIKQQLNNLK